MTGEARLRDTPLRYGGVTRTLHGLTAVLVLWQFAIVALYKIFGETPLLNAVASVGPHGYVGLAILAFALARILWAIANAGRRPAPASRAASLAHGSIYALMVACPALALARLYAKGEGLTIAGVEIFAATGFVTAWVVALADALHGPLSWTLLALVAVHSAAAALHHTVRRDAFAGRMFGAPAGGRP